MHLQRIVVLLVFSFILPFSLFANGILSSGKWVKLEFGNTGVYKIDYAQCISLGLNPSSMNPMNIHFYSIQGDQLNETNDSNLQNVSEVPILVVG